MVLGLVYQFCGDWFLTRDLETIGQLGGSCFYIVWTDPKYFMQDYMVTIVSLVNGSHEDHMNGFIVSTRH